MLRSLFTGITGVRSHQLMLDVTGNNVANVNTTGFKTSQTVFGDTISQMMQGASAPQPGGTAADLGGTNPAQVGLGVKFMGMSSNFTQGSTQLTGRTTDVMINGDGFFMVNAPGGETLYTRAGSFSFDRDGYLVAPNGSKVLGYSEGNGTAATLPTAETTNPANPALNQIQLPEDDGAGSDPSELKSFEIGPDGAVTATFENGTDMVVGYLAISNFTNPQGLVKTGDSMYRVSQNSGKPDIFLPGKGARGRLTTGTLEMSNVDLATEFTNMIIAQRGLQANSRTITTSDEVLQELVNLKR